MVAFELFGRPVAWYGIIIAFGFVAAIAFCFIKIIKYKIPTDPFYYYCILGIPTSILSGRLGSVIIGQTPIQDYWMFETGGMSILYAVLGTVIVGMIYFPLILRHPKYMIRDESGEKPVVRRVSIWVYADAIIPCILVGQIIGRWGNYVNQELTGPKVTDPGFINFLKTCLPLMKIDGEWFQPFFLYEALINVVGFVLIYFIVEKYCKKIRKCGDMGILYFLWYGIVRICLEPFRIHSDGHLANIITSILWIVIPMILLVLNHTYLLKLRHYKFYYIIGNEIMIVVFIFSKKRDKYKENRKYYKYKQEEELYYLGY